MTLSAPRGKGIGVYASANFTPAAAAYSANDLMDVAKEMPWYIADTNGYYLVPPGSLIRVTTSIMKIDVTALQSGEGEYKLRNFSVTPPTAYADNDAFAPLVSANLSAYRGAFSLGTPVDEGSVLYIKQGGLTEEIHLAADQSSSWGLLQTLAGFTATAVARQVILYGFIV